MVAPKRLISCRRAENIHGSLKSGGAPSLTRLPLGWRYAKRSLKIPHPPPILVSPSRPWQRSFNPRQTVRDISSLSAEKSANKTPHFLCRAVRTFSEGRFEFSFFFFFFFFLFDLTDDWSARTLPLQRILWNEYFYFRSSVG